MLKQNPLDTTSLLPQYIPKYRTKNGYTFEYVK